jgi:hypothetical protein
MLTYSKPRLEALFDDWPFGRTARTTAHFKIEADPARGERAARRTLDPRTEQWCAWKRLTYARKARIVDGSDGKTYIAELTMYGFVMVMRSDMRIEHETMHRGDPRHAAALALFEGES